MPAGLAAAGYMALTFETAVGTYLPPTTAGTVFVPILSETVAYNEDAYYSSQIRQQVVESSREQGYYHVEGDVVMEFDANYLPYLMYLSRHTIAKTGAGPYQYLFTPSTAGSATTAASGAVPRTASLSFIRNGVGFGYGGCVINTMEFTIDSGILRCTFGILGLSEVQPGGLGTPAWVAPSLMGAAAHSVYVDTAGTAPAFATAATTFNGFTANINHNGSAENRINASRAAAYIAYHNTEATFTTELDFLDRTEYDNMKNNTRRAIKLESLKGGANFGVATEAFQLIMYNTAYDTYPVNLTGMNDLVMASGVTGRALVQAGGSPYQIGLKSAVTIA